MPRLNQETMLAMADFISEQLAHAGLFSVTPSGQRRLVRISRCISSDDDRWALFEIDTANLPDRVTAPDLKKDTIKTHLATTMGYPLRRLFNGTGITYVFDMQPELERAHTLPTTVALPDQAPANYRYAVPFGLTPKGEMLWGELANLPKQPWTGSILIGATSGYGKTSAMTSLLVSLLRVHGPTSLRLALVDPKATDLAAFDRLPHLLCPVATDSDAAFQVVELLTRELEKRKARIAASGARNLWQYNDENPDHAMPLIVSVWDEMYDIAMGWGGTKSPPYRLLNRLLAQGRAFGIVNILATQYPRSDVIDTLLRSNCSTRMALYCSEAVQYKSILGEVATLDAIPGRAALIGPWGGTKIIQGCLVTEAEVKDAVDRWVSGPRVKLTGLEARMVITAAERYSGEFTIRGVYQEFRGEISSTAFNALAKSWHDAGWLTQAPTDRDGKKPRRITSTLLELAKGTNRAQQGD